MIYLIYCKNFYKCHNVPQPSTTTNIIKYFEARKKFGKSGAGWIWSIEDWRKGKEIRSISQRQWKITNKTCMEHGRHHQKSKPMYE
jgi:hypothetical protein